MMEGKSSASGASRIAQLERAQRRQRAVNVGLLLVAVSGLLFGFARPTPDEVGARRFVVKDEQGVIRAAFGVSGATASMRILSAEGVPQVELKVDETGGSLWINHTDGKAGLLMLDSGLSLADSLERPRAHLDVGPEGGASLRFLDAAGGNRVGLCELENETVYLTLRDAKTKASVDIGVGDGESYVQLADLAGVGRNELRVFPDGNPSITLSDAEKQARVGIYSSAESDGLDIMSPAKGLRLRMISKPEGFAGVALGDPSDPHRVNLTISPEIRSASITVTENESKASLGMRFVPGFGPVLDVTGATGKVLFRQP